MRLLHIEASPGWGGQELRALKEAEGMRLRGHHVVFCIQKGGGLVAKARKAGFTVYELAFRYKYSLQVLTRLMRIMRKEKIEKVITHSSLDAWLGGIAAKCMRLPIVRTRHLSSSIRPGLNSFLLYNFLADVVVTTCAEIVPIIQKQARLHHTRCLSIPTGVEPFSVDKEQVDAFKQTYGIAPSDCVVGTLCVLRGWKGVCSLIHAANRLKQEPHLKWLIVGSGPSEEYFRQLTRSYQLEDRIIFTGYLSNPYSALAAMDIFALCSHSHEGVSQASLQAAWLEKPLITTPTGGLKEVCIPDVTGILVHPSAPDQVADAVQKLIQSPDWRVQLGKNAKRHVFSHFTLTHMLDRMENVLLNV